MLDVLHVWIWYMTISNWLIWFWPWWATDIETENSVVKWLSPLEMELIYKSIKEKFDKNNQTVEIEKNWSKVRINL